MINIYEYQIDPTEEQKIYFARVFGCVRFLYNQMLNDKIEFFKEKGEELKNTYATYRKQYAFLFEADTSALINAQMELEDAFANFLEDEKIGFPSFKKKKGNQSYTIKNRNGTITLKDGFLTIPKLDSKIKLLQSEPFIGNIKSLTISKTPDGKYYASIVVDPEEKEMSTKPDGKVRPKEFLTTPDGTKVEVPEWIRKTEKKIKKAQRSLLRKQENSNNHKKAELYLTKLQRKLANQKKDFLHKIYLEGKNEEII